MEERQQQSLVPKRRFAAHIDGINELAGLPFRKNGHHAILGPVQRNATHELAICRVEGQESQGDEPGKKASYGRNTAPDRGGRLALTFQVCDKGIHMGKRDFPRQLEGDHRGPKEGLQVSGIGPAGVRAVEAEQVELDEVGLIREGAPEGAGLGRIRAWSEVGHGERQG